VQFGQILLSFSSAQVEQKVHSNVQILASSDSLGKSELQHSQFGRSFIMERVPQTTSERAEQLQRAELAPASEAACLT
jgi:hypothetical protein